VYITVYTEKSIVEIRSAAQWNPIARSMTASLPVLSPSSILPPPSPNRTFGPAWKNSKRCPKRSPIQYFTFLGALAKLRKATISFLMPLRLSVRPSVRMK